jgi:hypothetical protein
MLVSSLESRLANSMSADAVELLKQKHAEELQGLQSHAAKAQELEAELTKAWEAESKLRLEFDQQLAREREILSVKYESEVDELRMSLDAKVKNHDAKIDELEPLQKLDGEQHDQELGVWRARDRKLHSGLLGLEDAIHGMLPSPLPSFRSFRPFPHSLVALAEAFPNSDGAAVAALEEYRVEQKIVHSHDPKAKLSSGELMASVNGRLHPVVELGEDLCQAVVSVFKALWPGRAVPDDIQTLLKWIPLASNRVDIWKESAARAGAAQALEFVLLWYPGVNLDQLVHLREGGLVGLDEAKLRQRARTIAECADTSVLFDTGESDESLDDVDFEEPAPQRRLRRPPKIRLRAPFLHPPAELTSFWQLGLATLPCWSRLARRWPPDCVKVSLLVCMCVELMPCPVTSRSCTPMMFHPKSLMRRFLIVCELDFV